MLRRIVIIVLVVVVILVAIFAIRYYLSNNDVGDPGVAEGDTTTTVDESDENAAPDSQTTDASVDTTDTGEEAAEGYPASESRSGDAVVTEGEEAVVAEGEEAVAVEGEEAAVAEGEEVVVAEGEEAAVAESEETVVAEGEETVSADGSVKEAVQEGVETVVEGVAGAVENITSDRADATESTEAAAGGDASTGDPNAGGGVPAEGEAASSAEDSAATTTATESTGTGGIGDVAAFSPIALFAEPGVPVEHKAENLEWLTQLARCYGTTVADIQAANNFSCPDLIYPGTIIKIANPGNAGPITINEAPCFVYYTVQQGDTLNSIAGQFGIHYQWLARINAVYNYNYIQVGQTLVIPVPVDPVFTQPPAEPFFYSNCWYGYCPGWQYPPVAVPYGY